MLGTSQIPKMRMIIDFKNILMYSVVLNIFTMIDMRPIYRFREFFDTT